MRKISLSKKLIHESTLIATSLIVLLGLVVILMMYKNLFVNIEVRKAELIERYQDKVVHYFKSPEAVVARLAESWDNLEINLDAFMWAYPKLTSLRVVDQRGKIITARPELNEGLFQDLSEASFIEDWPMDQKPHWTEVYTDKEGKPSMAVYAANDEYLVLATLDIASMNRSFSLGRKNPMVTATLVNRQGVMIAADDLSRVLNKEKVTNFDDFTIDDQGDIEEGTLWKGDKIMTLNAISGTRDWYLILEYSAWYLYEPLVMSLLQMVAIVLIVIGSSISIIKRNSRLVILEIEDLKNTAYQVALGDYQQPLKQYTFLELDMVAQSLNQLSNAVSQRESQIKEINHKLEEIVTLRTNELLVLNQNLSEIVAQRTRELDLALQQAQSATLEKSMFLADVSHEIRTPLNGLLSIVTALKETPLNAEQGVLIEGMTSASKSLRAILEDVLDFSKIESGNLDIENQTLNLVALGNEIMRVYQYAAAERGLALKMEISSEIPKDFMGDPRRIHQVLANLVMNAIKFTQVGSVTLAIDGRPLINTSNYEVTFSVRDTGKGIASHQIASIFERYKQVEQNGGPKTGSGLGLAIAKRLAQLMQGDIRVESQVGSGSTFSLCLPMAPVSVSDKPVDQSLTTSNVIGQRRLLAVEDDPVSLMVLTAMLAKKGYTVDGVVNGLEATSALEANAYDLVLLDINMPVMNGLETIAWIRKHPNKEISELKVIAMTAYTMKGDRDRFIGAGMSDYLSKPIDYEVLFNKLTDYLGSSEAAISLDLLTKSLQEATGLEGTQCQYIVEAFVQQGLDLIAQLKSKLAGGDFEGLAKLLHQLKGSAGNVRAFQIVALASQGEALARDKAVTELESIAKKMSEIVLSLQRQLKEKVV